MQIFYNCSFKSSNGFRMVNYEYGENRVTCLDEKADREKFSPSVLSTLRYGLGRSMLLAIDETGCCFLGIYNLISGNYDKYVNAVFWDFDREKILKLFFLFCYRYQDAKNMLQNTIERIPPDENGLEYCVIKSEVENLIKLSANEEVALDFGNTKSRLLAFITEESCSDYLSRIEEYCNLSVKNAFLADNVSGGQTNVDISGFLQKKTFRVPLGIIAILIIIIVLVLFAIF